jgi:hypothetical protein
VIGAAIILLYPILLKDFLPPTYGMVDYLKDVFKFDETQATFSAIALIASPLALILSVLPPTLKYLRGSSRSSGYDDYPQQPGGGYPQTPPSGYAQTPNSGGFSQPDLGYPQQGYPQQPQQPQQPGW